MFAKSLTVEDAQAANLVMVGPEKVAKPFTIS
jgi:hypothetical protein